MPINRRWRPWKTQESPTQTQQTETQANTAASRLLGRWFNRTGLGHLLLGIWAISGAIATSMDWSVGQSMERQTQAFFFQLRGSVKPPENIVILAIDEHSLSQGKLYRTDPQKLADFEPLQTWPWKREAYAKAIERLMAAGAQSVAVDLVFDAPSSYGQADDEQLRQVLQKYAGRVTLAALYEDDRTRPGSLTQLIKPDAFFQTSPMSVGAINYLIEPNGGIHRLSSQFPKVWSQDHPELAKEFLEFVATVPSFDEATLQAAGVKYSPPKGENIFFYGPPKTFEQISFSDVLDPENWNTYLKGGKYFKNKIVIIGPTSTLSQDLHRTPFSAFSKSMPGVEIHANAIATLLENRSIAEAIPNAAQRGLFVFIGVVGTGFAITRLKKGPIRIGLGIGIAIAWGGISYLCFIHGRLNLPTAVPVVAIALSSLSYGTIGSIKEHISKHRLRRTLKRYSSSPIVQEIISQADELQDLIQEREQEIMGQKLAGRYKIIKLLGSGGFGETYIAEDTLRPGNPQCVVKQLRPASNNPNLWKLGKRLFITEAETLERLGTHDQIPQLLAYFEEGEEFYLVEELIGGHPLSQEMPLVVPLAEAKVIAILRDVLPILAFVHSQGVIHRDIKPDNMIRRNSDNKLVLIDFGAVKELSTQLTEVNEQTNLTVGIGTKGYTPSEQSAGNPKFNSDIYALGMIAVQALTAKHPSQLPENPDTGEILWEDKAEVSPELAAVLNKMIRSNFRDRYQSAKQVLEALQPWIGVIPTDISTNPAITQDVATTPLSDTPNGTMPWPEASIPTDPQDSTMPWPEASILTDPQDSTMLLPEASIPTDPQDSTMPWPDSPSSEESSKKDE